MFRRQMVSDHKDDIWVGGKGGVQMRQVVYTTDLRKVGITDDNNYNLKWLGEDHSTLEKPCT